VRKDECVHGAPVGGLSPQGRLTLLADASAHLADSLDLRAVARGLAHIVVPRLAEQVDVDLVEGLFHPDMTSMTGTSVLCRVASASLSRDPAGTAEDEWVGYPAGSAAAVALSSDRIQAGDETPEHGAEVFAPLLARGRVLGVVGLRRSSGAPGYSEADIALAEEIAGRAAMALDNVRLYDEARATSVALQRSLLPTAQPQITGVATAQRYLPGSREVGVGGDWFDVIPLSCGRVAFVIGDVMGRGLRAAAAMGQLRTAVRTLAVLDHLPEDVLRHLDDLAQGTDQVQLATCVYAVYDPVGRELSFATAGHPPPVLREPDGSTRLLSQPSGAPLGVGGVAFESVTMRVRDGSRLLLYTDGLVESREIDLDDGLSMLADAFGREAIALEPLCDELLAATGRDGRHDDDVALIVAEISGLESERVASWQLTGGVESVAAARSWAVQRFAEWGLDSLGELAELLVSEIVTNALRHAAEPIELTILLLDEIITIAVEDAAAPLPRLRRVTEADEAVVGCSWSRRCRPGGGPGRPPAARSCGAT
jgi:serine phosphatase RsbU (regulator of sigma subunit)